MSEFSNIGQYTLRVGVLVHTKLPQHSVRVEEKRVLITSPQGKETSIPTDLHYSSMSVEQAAQDIYKGYTSGNVYGSGEAEHGTW